jgi:putative ABC transport system permease protein
MRWIALRMLTGNRGKYLGMIFGVAFASLLMAHQVSIFCGVMRRTTSQILDVGEADVWVMDPTVRYIEEAPGLAEGFRQRVRGVPGVAWAVPLYKGTVRARLGTGDYRQVMLLGIDDATLIGAPRDMVLGEVAGLRRPDGILLGEAGYRYLWPGEPLRLGRVLEINDCRAVVVGICKTSAPYQTVPVAYTRYNQAGRYAPRERHRMSFLLVGVQPGVAGDEVCRRIQERTGLQALTREGFCRQTISYYLEMTAIPLNFGITVLLGFVVGVAVAGQTFYLFTLENLKHFGTLKALGVTNRRLISMILAQALVVGSIGYGFGMGLTALFFEWTKNQIHLQGFFLPGEVMAGTGAAVLLIVVLASLLSIRRVLVLEPAIVFRG